MARFFFHIEGVETEILDTMGVTLPDAGDVADVCKALIAEVAGQETWLDMVSSDHRMRVTDESGRTVLIAALGRLTSAPEEFLPVATNWSADAH